jgi:hypothetical protein
MEIIELNERKDIQENIKLHAAYRQFETLIGELKKRDLPDKVVITINNTIHELNAVSQGGKVLRSQIRQKQTEIIRLLEKELKIVAINHYRNTWLAIGMSVFGIPLGVVFGTSLGNMAFLGIGIPLGMVIGMGVGAGMDKKAAEEGRQLNIEIKN